MNTTRRDTTQQILHMRLFDDQYPRIVKLAEQNKNTVTGMSRLLLEEALAAREKAAARQAATRAAAMPTATARKTRQVRGR